MSDTDFRTLLAIRSHLGLRLALGLQRPIPCYVVNLRSFASYTFQCQW